MNIELLREIQKCVLENPDRVFMPHFISDIHTRQPRQGVGPDTIDNCGTAGCIGGWALMLAARRDGVSLPTTVEQIERVLDLKRFQGSSLLWTANWPVVYARRYQFADTDEERAKAVCERIDNFIESNGTD